MTAHNHHASFLTSPSFVREAKEKRKQQLAAVRQRRKIIYAQYLKKVQAVNERQNQP